MHFIQPYSLDMLRRNPEVTKKLKENLNNSWKKTERICQKCYRAIIVIFLEAYQIGRKSDQTLDLAIRIKVSSNNSPKKAGWNIEA